MGDTMSRDEIEINIERRFVTERREDMIHGLIETVS